VNITSGAGYADVNGRLDTSVRLGFVPPFPPLPDILIETRSSTDVHHTNVYAYSYINPLKDVTFILGASGDFANGDSINFKDSEQLNPKLGLMWNPLPTTTVRGAAFRVLKRTLITNQTLEPTEVAGFNQFFDDFDGTNAWRYGGAIDQKLPNDVFAGVEFSQRDVDVPFVDARDPARLRLRNEGQRESQWRAYLFWAPHPWWALRAEYIIERLKTRGLTSVPRELDTHRVPAGINFFHPSGLGASLNATYFDQDGTFVLNNGTIRTGQDDFWVVDAALNYRLPNRYGFITIGASNLLDKEFRFFDRDRKNPSIQPERFVFARFTLALP
jgi:hypothetical protein